ncbi:retrotransposon protein, putative, ty1-copia subclass [Tanacetum coccineum]
MLRKCHGHGLTKGAIIQIFYHGLDEPTQGILDITAGGIFLYKTPNQAYQFLEDKVLFKLDWSTKSQNEHHRKSVSFADGSDSNTDNSLFMEKLKAMDSKIISLNEELQDMNEKYNELREGNAYNNDDTPMWIDYNEVFSSVVRHTSIRVILSLTTCEDYDLEQLDVKMAFLHGNLEKTIYMRQPPGFEEGTGNKVCLLKKSLYGLKQSPRHWHVHIYLLLYVDDMLIANKSMSEIEYSKGLLRKEFDMKELGPARKILGIEIVKDRVSRTLKVSRSGYVQKILNNYIVDNGKSVSVPLGAHFKVSLKDCPSSDWDVERMSKVPYANVVGSLMYLMVCTRPDIAYTVSIVSRYLVNPRKNHWEAVKWILKYLKGTAYVGLVYGRYQGKHVDVDGFVEADYAKDPDKGRSMTGYMFMVHGCAVSWKATLQHVVALSTIEAEYMALTEAIKESIWLKDLLIELGVNLRSVVVNCDNQGAIHLSRNAMFHEWAKHINVRYHFIREIMESKEIEVAKINTEDNATKAFTKVVLGLKFKYCMEILGVGAN